MGALLCDAFWHEQRTNEPANDKCDHQAFDIEVQIGQMEGGHLNAWGAQPDQHECRGKDIEGLGVGKSQQNGAKEGASIACTTKSQIRLACTTQSQIRLASYRLTRGNKQASTHQSHWPLSGPFYRR